MNILQVPLSSNSLASVKENEFKSCIPLYYSEDHTQYYIQLEVSRRLVTVPRKRGFFYSWSGGFTGTSHFQLSGF